MFRREKNLVAYVGAHRPITQRDLNSVQVAKTTAPDFFPPRPNVEIVNLDYGRDFLAETAEYDAVILFSIFQGGQGSDLLARMSPLNSLENWRRRLASTHARKIAVVSMIPYSLDGWQLGDIAGYTITARNESVTIYERETL